MEPREGGAIERYVPSYDVRTAHEIEVEAPAAETYRAARALDVGRSLPVTALFALRAVPHLLTGKARLTRSITLETLFGLGFVILEEEAPTELVLGAIGRFWRPDSGMVRIAPDEFTAFATPGFAKGVLAFTVDRLGSATSLLATETRVACTDDSARRKFSLYWRAIGPFSGLIRRLMLNEVKRAAEGARR
jgi:hypothetical protein